MILALLLWPLLAVAGVPPGGAGGSGGSGGGSGWSPPWWGSGWWPPSGSGWTWGSGWWPPGGSGSGAWTPPRPEDSGHDPTATRPPDDDAPPAPLPDLWVAGGGGCGCTTGDPIGRVLPVLLLVAVRRRA